MSTKKIKKSIKDFKSRQYKFINNDLMFDFEKIKSYDLPIKLTKSCDENLHHSYIIDVADSSYFYANHKDRDHDFKILNNYFLKQQPKQLYASIRIVEAESEAGAILKTEDNIFKEDHDLSDVVIPVNKIRIITDVESKMESSWDFVEEYHPDYSCQKIGLANDLEKIIQDEDQEGDAANRLRLELEAQGKDVMEYYKEVHYEIYRDSIQNFILKQKKGE